jgi:GDP-L-fucose synthase
MIDKDVLDSFKDKKILVTGGTGLIGRQVVNILCNSGSNVIIVSFQFYVIVELHRTSYLVLNPLTKFTS